MFRKLGVATAVQVQSACIGQCASETKVKQVVQAFVMCNVLKQTTSDSLLNNIACSQWGAPSVFIAIIIPSFPNDFDPLVLRNWGSVRCIHA